VTKPTFQHLFNAPLHNFVFRDHHHRTRINQQHLIQRQVFALPSSHQYQQHLPQETQEHSSLCQSKISRPSVSPGLPAARPFIRDERACKRVDRCLFSLTNTPSSCSHSFRISAHFQVTKLTCLLIDPFAEADEDTGETKQSQNYIHIRIQRKFIISTSHSLAWPPRTAPPQVPLPQR
jgi:hypothetical protein